MNTCGSVALTTLVCIPLAQYAVIPVLQYLLVCAAYIISAPLGHVNKHESSMLRPLGNYTGYERKGKDQVCHFPNVPHILLHKSSIHQETLLIELALETQDE